MWGGVDQGGPRRNDLAWVYQMEISWQMTKLVGSQSDILSNVSAWCVTLTDPDKKLTFPDRPHRQVEWHLPADFGTELTVRIIFRRQIHSVQPKGETHGGTSHDGPVTWAMGRSVASNKITSVHFVVVEPEENWGSDVSQTCGEEIRAASRDVQKVSSTLMKSKVYISCSFTLKVKKYTRIEKQEKYREWETG